MDPTLRRALDDFKVNIEKAFGPKKQKESTMVITRKRKSAAQALRQRIKKLEARGEEPSELLMRVNNVRSMFPNIKHYLAVVMKNADDAAKKGAKHFPRDDAEAEAVVKAMEIACYVASGLLEDASIISASVKGGDFWSSQVKKRAAMITKITKHTP